MKQAPASAHNKPLFCPTLLCTIAMGQWLQFPLNNWLSAACDRQEGMGTARDAPVPDLSTQPTHITLLYPLSPTPGRVLRGSESTHTSAASA